MNSLSPAKYRPWIKGSYDVSPSLKAFGTDFGNGELDQKVFQIDLEWRHYVQSKKSAVAENPDKYIARKAFSPRVENAVVDFISKRLVREWPDFYLREQGKIRLEGNGAGFEPTLENLCLHIQEDIAVVVRDAGKDWIAYVNVCNPSHWFPSEKIGQSFFDAHIPVPGFEKVNAVAKTMVDSMIGKGPFVRFVWGLESDHHLNHHPVAPPEFDQESWYGRQFDKDLFVRVERQVLWPLPEYSAALFTIRPIVYHASEVQKDEASWSKLVQAVNSMSPEARAYKGIPREFQIFQTP